MKLQLLAETLEKLAEDIKAVIDICPRSKNAIQFDIGKTHRFYGIRDDASQYIGVVALAPVEVLPRCIPLYVEDPRAQYPDYVQLESGLAVPRWVADKAGLEFEEYNYPTHMGVPAGYFTPEIFKGK